jgi:hypothetical protein
MRVGVDVWIHGFFTLSLVRGKSTDDKHVLSTDNYLQISITSRYYRITSDGNNIIKIFRKILEIQCNFRALYSLVLNSTNSLLCTI